MFGLNNGLSMMNSLCDTFDFILLQEHWLTSADLYKLNCINNDFTAFSVSAMDAKTENGILVGRPYGGTAILCRNSILKYVQLIEVDPTTGRYISIRYRTNSLDLIITNVYFPTYNASTDYTIECSSLVAYFERVIDDFSNCKHIIAGDFNFSCTDNSAGFCIFKRRCVKTAWTK